MINNRPTHLPSMLRMSPPVAPLRGEGGTL